MTNEKSQKNSSDARDALGNFRFLGPYRLSMYEAVLIYPEWVGETNEAHAKQLDHQLSSS